MMKNQIQILSKERDNLKMILNNLNLIKDEGIKKLDEKYKKLSDEKMKILDDLMSKTNINNVRPLNNNELSNGEKLIAINFVSVDQSINHTIFCKNNTKFYEIEKELYEKFPVYAGDNNCLMFNNLKLDRWKTLEENNINSYTIVLNKIDNK